MRPTDVYPEPTARLQGAIVAIAMVAMPLAAIHARGVDAKGFARTLSFGERIDAQRAIEQVYWDHRIWPKDNPGPKPPLTAVITDDAIRAKVEDYLRASHALDSLWKQPITAEQLQAEIDRMAENTRDGEMLEELFRALGNDAFIIAETLARQTLAERLIRSRYSTDDRNPGEFDAWWEVERGATQPAIEPPQGTYTLPSVPSTTCTEDAWSATRLDATTPAMRFDHTAVWTGSEVIVWGGWTGATGTQMNTGGRYSPSTDTWSATSLAASVPSARRLHTAVWTGTEMILWGGIDGTGDVNTGGRYSPLSNTWVPTSTGVNLPDPRNSHTAVWTGTEMIVWGGHGSTFFNTGGRYNPSTNGWLLTSTGANLPSARLGHTAVWTGTEMIVWGGDTGGDFENSGGRYKPSTDGWTTTSQGVNNPTARVDHTAVWTGAEMIVWGGIDKDGFRQNSGGRYNPLSNAWSATSTGANVPAVRSRHAAAWTGTEMIVWGGFGASALNTGGRYTPSGNSWAATSTAAGVPAGRSNHTAVWTGNQVIVWGGSPTTASGGRYCIASCASPAIWYQDQDADGFGLASVTVPACTQPAGYAATAGECNDTNPAIHPGATEVCNGVDDNCDNVVDNGAFPAEADNGVRVASSGGSALLSWNLAAGATTSDVLRGLVNALPVGPGGADETCLAIDTGAVTLMDADALPTGRGFWYLVRGGNACGNGTYGFQTQNGVPTVQRVSTTCP